MERLYDRLARRHFADNRQMLFVSGPRQVGKTTTARRCGERWESFHYYTWDNVSDRALILAGPDRVAEDAGLAVLSAEPPLLVFDDLHKHLEWKDFLKGLFDSWPGAARILVTGSARLDAFRTGGDSLMGRYFSYRQHPLSVAEMVRTSVPDQPISAPRPLDEDQFGALDRYGGFPEPIERQDTRFYNRWRRLRSQQLFQEDMRELTRIQEIALVETLAELLRRRAGSLTNLSSLARDLRVSVDTVRRWLRVLEALYYCFSVRPWSRNISRALRKEPKTYLWDWSLVAERGPRSENLVASALLKAVHFWTDHGFGDFRLWFVRDKEKREVDFLVSRDDQPWFLVEVKQSGAGRISPALRRFQDQTEAPHAFQVQVDLPHVDRDCFEVGSPVIVPAVTFLSQLV